MKLVEVEGTHTIQTSVSSLDVHVGQSYSVLITANQPEKYYYIVVSSRFTPTVLTTTGVLHYNNSVGPVSGPIPAAPTLVRWSFSQARAIRTNLTASGPRPNPQGSYHYGMINVTRTIKLVNSAGLINDKQRYAVNIASFFPTETPLKLADYFKIDGIYKPGSICDQPRPRDIGISPVTSVMQADYRAFVEIIFENRENIVQSWHFNGYSFFVVGMELGKWSPDSTKVYNLNDAVSRCTVYPRSWTAIYVVLDSVGMWNLRSELWERQYLGQQFYMRVYTNSTSLRDEYQIPLNALLCGRAAIGRHKRLF
ncbi:L-ascorbate oxidase-like protein [Cardamine amara subsp. amara]|uniref:L-ascorbate oxidase-like protein n=1 Tax=Cardamine amara subsp. amara TaxID=228776 RepID=A0ABD1B5T5_CARAN